MTSISLRLGVALLGAILLSACDESGNVGGLSFLAAPSDESSRAGLTRVRLAGGAIVVSGPEGYCVDGSTLRNTQNRGFAAIASCNILSGGKTGPVVEPVLVTIAVERSSGEAPALPDLAAALGTELARSRELSAVAVGQMASGGSNAFQGSDQKHWRGTLELGNYLVGLALYAPSGSPLLGNQGAAFLNTVSSRIRANSRVPNQSAEQSQPAADPVASALGRLFGNRDL